MPFAILDAQVTCPCGDERDFGSCLVGTAVEYPGNFPGSATVASYNKEGRDIVSLYVADLYDGYTYVYDGTVNAGVLNFNTPYSTYFSPAGSKSTTGIAFHPVDLKLIWCVEDTILQTDLALGNVKLLSTVHLDTLKAKLGLTSEPIMGGITYHVARDSFWAVDIANDLYFEFNAKTGTISEDGTGVPIHFKNPRLSTYGGGAYGNSIAYINVDGASYFDIPVGRLIEGGVKEVVRVHAMDGGEGETAHSIGDPAGISYTVATAAGDHGFISGIAYWPMTCNATSHTEILLDIRSSGSTQPPSIYQVSVDDPKSASLVQFAAVASGSDVQLSWTPGSSYNNLEIKRRQLPSGTFSSIKTFSDFAADPRQFVDKALPDGYYQYEAVVTPTTGRKLPAPQAEVNIGMGTVVDFVSFRLADRPTDQDPFAITCIDSSKEIVVVDRTTGWAHRYDTDLYPKGSFAGPFIADMKRGGTSTGIAYDPDRGRLAWVLQSTKGCIIQETDLVGKPAGSRMNIQVPVNLKRVPLIADISYDPIGKTFWGVDMVNLAAYSFDYAGNLTGLSSTAQIESPLSPGGEFGGGIALIPSVSTAGKITLDMVLGKQATGGPRQLLRRSFNRSDTVLIVDDNDSDVEIREVVQSLGVGGIVSSVVGGVPYEYVVGTDTGTIYKLDMRTIYVAPKQFQRGDVDGDEAFTLSDPINILFWLFFESKPDIQCFDAADVDDSAVDTNPMNGANINITDAVFLFNHLFLSGDAPPAPYPGCGIDQTISLGCGTSKCQ